jgi:hypothetical protein
MGTYLAIPKTLLQQGFTALRTSLSLSAVKPAKSLI